MRRDLPHSSLLTTIGKSEDIETVGVPHLLTGTLTRPWPERSLRNRTKDGFL